MTETGKDNVQEDGDRAGKPDIQGEGNYDAARKFDAEERAFIEKAGPDGVARKAREAEDALEGPEGDELERARRETGERGRMDEG